MNREPADEPLDFTILCDEPLGGAFRPLRRITLAHASLSGGEKHRVVREILRAGTAVVIIPYDPSRDEIALVRQFRIGAALAGPNAAPLELPAGLVDEGEDAKDAARRELAEETGLRARSMGEAFSILSSPGLSDEKAVVFLALVDMAALQDRAGLAEESEDILPLAFRVADLILAADEGRIENGFLFASLQWFARRGREEAGLLSAGTGPRRS